MIRSVLRLLPLAGVAALAFAGSYVASGTDQERLKIDRLLSETRRSDAAVVCAGAEPCIRPEAAFTLLVFFSSLDCPPCLYDTVELEALHRRAGQDRLNVLGVAYDMSPDQARRFAEASGITYPLQTDTRQTERHIQNPKPEGSVRPVKVLVDRSGRIVRTWQSGITLDAHQRDVEEILGIVGS